MADMSVTAPARGITIAERRRVVAATTVGTAIEWYDYFLYAAAAGLVFRTVVFAPLGPAAATVVSFLTVGLSFLVRPFGALLAGHYGDRIGRRTVLMVTLLCMGASTTLIGLLPTYASIGVWSPVLLIVLRVLQGVSAGGEWGGAVLMSVEHAPVDRRGLYGSGPQVGVPIGLLMASGALGLVSVIAPGDAFTAWGWRIPFLVSAVLVVVGYLVRHGVEESPVFTEIVERGAAASAPVGVLLRGHLPVVVVAALVFAGNGAVGYMTTGGYIQSYATDPAGPLRMDRTGVLLIVSASAVVWGCRRCSPAGSPTRPGTGRPTCSGSRSSSSVSSPCSPSSTPGTWGCWPSRSPACRWASGSPTASSPPCTPSSSPRTSGSPGCR